MIDRNKTTGQSGRSQFVALAITAIAVGAIVMVASMNMRTETVAAAGVAGQAAAADEAPFVYFPAQYVNQATEIEPMPPTF